MGTTCKKCSLTFNPEAVPFINNICWDCHTQGDREYFKTSYENSPSLVEQAYLHFIEWYEQENSIRYFPERRLTVESNWQEQAGTRTLPFWEQHMPEEKRPGGFKPSPEDKRRPAPGLE